MFNDLLLQGVLILFCPSATKLSSSRRVHHDQPPQVMMTLTQAAPPRPLVCVQPHGHDVVQLVLCHGAHDPDARCGGTKVSRTQWSPIMHVRKGMWHHVV